MLFGLSVQSSALGITVASFTALSGVASALLLVMNFVNGQYFNYISLLALAVSLDKCNSVFQQLYTLMNFSEVQQKSYDMAIEYFRCRGTEELPLFTAPDKPLEISITIYQFLLNAQGLLFFYWSLILFSSSWSLQPPWWKNQKIVYGTKVSCLLIPTIQMILLRIPAISANDIANLIVMNIVVCFNIGLASVFLLLTLFHIISVHRAARGSTRIRLSRTYDGVIEYHQSSSPIVEKPSLLSAANFLGMRKFGSGSDGWLIAKIALAFVMVEGLQVYAIVMQIFYLQRWAHFKGEWQKGLSMPVVDQAEELANLCSPIPASFTGFLLFLVFGTTEDSKKALRKIGAWLCCTKRKEKRSESRSPTREKRKLQKLRRTDSAGSSTRSLGIKKLKQAGERISSSILSTNLSLTDSNTSPTQSSLLPRFESGTPKRPNRPAKVLSILTPTMPYPPTYSPTSANSFATPRSSNHLAAPSSRLSQSTTPTSNYSGFTFPFASPAPSSAQDESERHNSMQSIAESASTISSYSAISGFSLIRPAGTVENQGNGARSAVSSVYSQGSSIYSVDFETTSLGRDSRSTVRTQRGDDSSEIEWAMREEEVGNGVTRLSRVRE